MQATTLSTEHRVKLRSSALTDQQIDALVAAGYRTDQRGKLVIPYRNPDGSPQTMPNGSPWIRFRLAQAEIDADPKGQKYLSLKGAGCRLYHPALSPDHEKQIGDRGVPLRITEGELKGESCAVHDRKRVTIAIGGVDSWKDKRSGTSKPLPEFDQIPLNGREVRLCFDSDLHKIGVRSALGKLAIWLGKPESNGGKGARVYLERLPNAPERDQHGEIVRLGADDLIHNHGARGFLRICEIAKECVSSSLNPETNEREYEFTIPYDPEPDKAEATFIRAEYLTALLGRTWRSDPEQPDGWQRWTGTHWEQIDGNDPINAAVERFLDCQNWRIARAKANVTGLVAAFRRQIKPAADSSAAAGLLPFRNGCLRLSDQTFIPHRPENGNTWSLPYDYDQRADCPQIKAFLEDRLEDPASVAVFRAFARALLVSEQIKSFLEITGPGDTGKSVLAKLLQALVGSSNTAACTLQRIEDRTLRFETLKLRNKRLALFSECQDFSGQLQVLKGMTGDDPIPAEIKNGRHLEFFYSGGVVLVGNGPIRASDPSCAVINRRRSLLITKVVPTGQQRPLLKSDGRGGWTGELVPELPGLVNWCLAMPAAEARAALARDVASPARAEAEMAALLDTDLLADWADSHLIWEPARESYIRVGCAPGAAPVGSCSDDPERFLFPSYLLHVAGQGKNARPLALKTFRTKLVDLLRDTLGLPLPPANSDVYRRRGEGAVVPQLRWRTAGDEQINGLIRHAFLARIKAPEVATAENPSGERIGTDAERVGNGKTSVGNGWNGWNGSETPYAIEDQADLDSDAHIGGEGASTRSIYSIHSPQGFCRSASIPDPFPSIPDRVPTPQSAPAAAGQPVWVDGKPGWLLPSGVMPKGDGPTVMVLVVDPAGTSRQIERGRISLTSCASAA
ncbi:MAG: DUF5906 domain-containing protein [Cyanobium sp.]